MIISAIVGAATLAAVAWSGRAFVTWVSKRQERLEKRDALEHEAKLERERREGWRR
jgi:hypothetical protein